MGPDKFILKFWKIEHNFELARWILMKVVAFGVKTMRIEILKARGLGKIGSPRTRWIKILGMRAILGKYALARRISSFS